MNRKNAKKIDAAYFRWEKKIRKNPRINSNEVSFDKYDYAYWAFWAGVKFAIRVKLPSNGEDAE